tara:strand:- start:917 stop:1285 length:369 start_codon:yes stop_codon:yes gene_type:complete
MIRRSVCSITIGLFLLFLSGCGAPLRTAEVGLAPTTRIILIGDNLIGAQVSVNDNVSTITKEDAERYLYGVAGSADKDIERKNIISIDVTPGNIQLEVLIDGKVLLKKDLYLVDGQSREIKL